VQAMRVDSSGNVVLTGDFVAPQLAPALSAASTLTFDQLTLTSGSSYGEMYLVQYDAQGHVRWANQTSGRG
jgi:hypothetical protein